MLVISLSLRSIEAARLQLDDLDWRAGRIILRGKASREDGRPMPADLGDAFSACLWPARRPASRQVYVRPCSSVWLGCRTRRHQTPRFPPLAGAANFNLSVGGKRMVRSSSPKPGKA